MGNSVKIRRVTIDSDSDVIEDDDDNDDNNNDGDQSDDEDDLYDFNNVDDDKNDADEKIQIEVLFDLKKEAEEGKKEEEKKKEEGNEGEKKKEQAKEGEKKHEQEGGMVWSKKSMRMHKRMKLVEERMDRSGGGYDEQILTEVLFDLDDDASPPPRRKPGPKCARQRAAAHPSATKSAEPETASSEPRNPKSTRWGSPTTQALP